MRVKNIFAPLALVAAMSCGAHALADTATATFNVEMTILSSCAVAGGVVANFGEVDHISPNNDAEATFGVRCSPDTPYQIGLLSEKADGDGAGFMTNADGDVPYMMYQDSTRSEVWGNEIDSTTKADTGNGAEQLHTVYLRNTNSNFKAGTYSDTVTVTVTY